MHVPVLLNEVIEYLNPQPNENFIDCTIGGGGHAFEILKRIGPNGRVLGIDWDEEVIKKLEVSAKGGSDKRLEVGDNLILTCDSYSNLKNIVAKYNFGPVHGALFDLGMSSWDIEESGKGFSFQKNELLDMRYSRKQSLTAGEIIGRWSKEELERIFKEYGGERFAGRIARQIIEERKITPIRMTLQLARIVQRSVPYKFWPRKIHPATRIFQALRIAVNNELDNLKNGLEQALGVLAANGRLAVISFHSIEDGVVKNFFRDRAKEDKLKVLTKKPVEATENEIRANPRSRSAKLRAAIKI